MFTIYYFFEQHSFNSLFSEAAWVSRHENGKLFWVFNEARADGVAVASAGLHAPYLHLTLDR